MKLVEFKHQRAGGDIVYGQHPMGLFIISGVSGPEAKGHPGITLDDGSKLLVDDEGYLVRPLAKGDDEQAALHPGPQYRFPSVEHPLIVPQPPPKAAAPSSSAAPPKEPESGHKSGEKTEYTPLGTRKTEEEEVTSRKR